MKKHEKLNYNSETFFNMESKGMPVRVLLLNIQSFHISDFSRQKICTQQAPHPERHGMLLIISAEERQPRRSARK
jgi:hypothetical protein